jgi:hypothetical protein
MSDNLEYWKALKTPPDWAKKEIKGGRISGMTDINPQWRLLAMTEKFGPVGVGWKYEVVKLWTEPGCNDQVCAFSQVNVFFKHDDKWSDAIPGIGGSMLTTKEKNGLYTSDEAYKMATTDALSVAFKALGVGAEVYSGFIDSSKYFSAMQEVRTDTISMDQQADIDALINEVGANRTGFCTYYQIAQIEDLPFSQYAHAIKSLEKKRKS